MALMDEMAYGSILNSDYGPTSGGTTNYGQDETQTHYSTNENMESGINYGNYYTSYNNNNYKEAQDLYEKDNEQDELHKPIDDDLINPLTNYNYNQQHQKYYNNLVFSSNINQYEQQFEQHPQDEEEQQHHQQIGIGNGPINHQVDVINYVPMPVVKKIHVPYRSPVQIPISHAVLIPIRKPVPIHIPVTQQVQVPIEKELKIPIERVIPYPVERQIPVPIEKHVPYQVIRYVPLKVNKPFPIKVPVVKTVIHKIKESW